MSSYSQVYPQEVRQLRVDLDVSLPVGWDRDISTIFKSSNIPIATREASGLIMNAITKKCLVFWEII